MVELIGHIKNYEWGKLGVESEVAKLAQLNNDFDPDPNTPYAELWMGDHPSGQSRIKSTGEDLNSFIVRNYSKRNKNGFDKLPFLFKVLSIRKALSIQVHPNKEQAEKLHSERPDIYKDPNHKPELAIALTPFTALCGFRLDIEIETLIKVFKPLSDLLGNSVVAKLKGPNGIKSAYIKLMTSPEDKILKCINYISQNYTEDLENCELLEIFKTLEKDFPGDVGILSLFFFNVINLEPGQAMFLAANEPHAYLRGDCIECMACSDNVIRAGLTPKFKDVDTLLGMLNYVGDAPTSKMCELIKMGTVIEIISPIEDFTMTRITFRSKRVCNLSVPIPEYASILLVLEGRAQLKTDKYGELMVQRGSIIFIPDDAGNSIEFFSDDKSPEDFIAYMASCSSDRLRFEDFYA